MGSGSSVPLASAKMTLAFLLASAKVTGVWPVELHADVTPRTRGCRRRDVACLRAFLFPPCLRTLFIHKRDTHGLHAAGSA